MRSIFYSLILSCILVSNWSCWLFNVQSEPTVRTYKVYYISQKGYNPQKGYAGTTSAQNYLPATKIEKAFIDAITTIDDLTKTDLDVFTNFNEYNDLHIYMVRNAGGDPTKPAPHGLDLNRVFLYGIADVSGVYPDAPPCTNPSLGCIVAITYEKMATLPAFCVLLGQRIIADITNERDRAKWYAVAAIHELGHARGIQKTSTGNDGIEVLSVDHSGDDANLCVMQTPWKRSINMENPYFCEGHRTFIQNVTW